MYMEACAGVYHKGKLVGWRYLFELAWRVRWVACAESSALGMLKVMEWNCGVAIDAHAALR